MKRFHELLGHVRHRMVAGEDVDLTHITYDSRAAGPHSLYVARKGSVTDGHDFIADALSRGCRAFLCEFIPASLVVPHDVGYAVVTNSSTALAEASHALHDFPTRSITMIGVTGTNGKTSCTVIIKQLLEAHGCKVGLIGTTGSFIGDQPLPSELTTPEAPELCALFARMRDANVTHIVMEVSSHALALNRVFGIDFSVAVFTNLTQDHLDFHGTMEAYADAKALLFSGLRPDAIACVWCDDDFAARMLRDCVAEIHTVGTRMPGTFIRSALQHAVSDTVCASDGVSYVMDGMHVHAPLFGAFHVANTSLALTVLTALDFPVHRTLEAMRNVHGAPGRMEIVPMGSITGIVDYAHTPDALEKTLTSVREVMAPSQKLVLVVGCGGDRDATKRPVMAAIACRLADEVWLTSDNPRTEDPLRILRDMAAGIETLSTAERRSHVREQVNRRTAINEAVATASHHDIIVVAGKGHETYQIIGKEKLPFDDREVLRSALGLIPNAFRGDEERRVPQSPPPGRNA